MRSGQVGVDEGSRSQQKPGSIRPQHQEAGSSGDSGAGAQIGVGIGTATPSALLVRRYLVSELFFVRPREQLRILKAPRHPRPQQGLGAPIFFNMSTLEEKLDKIRMPKLQNQHQVCGKHAPSSCLCRILTDHCFLDGCSFVRH